MTTKNSPTLHISPSPLVEHSLTLMRDHRLPGAVFRMHLNNISMFLFQDALIELAKDGRAQQFSAEHSGSSRSDSEDRKYTFSGNLIDSSKLALVALMRSGQTMASEIHKFVPNAFIGHQGYAHPRDSDTIHEFYDGIPILEGRFCFAIDSATVTGTSLVAMIEKMIVQRGAEPSKIAVITTIITEQALEKLKKRFPNCPIKVFAAAKDPGIEVSPDRSQAIPGAGSFQERLFGAIVPTKIKFAKSEGISL